MDSASASVQMHAMEMYKYIEPAVIPPMNTEFVNLAAVFPYRMLLAHQVENRPPVLTSMVQRNYGQTYVLMDNSVMELGEAVGAGFLMHAAKLCSADELILPDVFHDGKATLDAVHTALAGALGRTTTNLMAVAHGPDLSTYTSCFFEFLSNPLIHAVGLPRIMEEDLQRLSGRKGFLRYLASRRGSIVFSKPVHFLGLQSSLNELVGVPGLGVVRSVDTSLPFKYAGMGIDLASYGGPHVDRSPTYLEDVWVVDTSLLFKGLNALCQVCGSPYVLRADIGWRKEAG